MSEKIQDKKWIDENRISLGIFFSEEFAKSIDRGIIEDLIDIDEKEKEKIRRKIIERRNTKIDDILK